MNSVVLIGRLTRDPEVRYTASTQMAVASFTVAIDRPVRAGGEKQTDFPRVTVFGKQAENCEKYLAKGRLVGVQGRIFGMGRQTAEKRRFRTETEHFGIWRIPAVRRRKLHAGRNAGFIPGHR